MSIVCCVSVGSGNPLTDPKALEKLLVWRGLRAVAPTVSDLTQSDLEAIRDRDYDALIPKLGQLVQRDVWEQGVDPDYLSDKSYGFAIQHKARERLYKLFSPPDRVQVDVTTRQALPQDQLLALLGELRPDLALPPAVEKRPTRPKGTGMRKKGAVQEAEIVEE